MKWKKIYTLILLALIVISGYFYFDLHQLSPAEFQEWILSFGPLAGLIYIVVYAIAPVLLLPGSILSLVAGALFGKGLGSLYVLIGANIAANLSFIVARYFTKDLQKGIEGGKQKTIKELNDKIAKNGFLAVLYLRLIPVFPFTYLNYALGFTKIKFRDYFLGTLLGMIPGIFAYVYLGESVTQIGSPQFWYAIAFFAFMAIVPALVKKYYGDKLFGGK